jgi:hypothetical protein
VLLIKGDSLPTPARPRRDRADFLSEPHILSWAFLSTAFDEDLSPTQLARQGAQ